MIDNALNVTATRGIATALLDPFCPQFADEESGGTRKHGFDAAEADRDQLVTVCRNASSAFNAAAEPDDAVLDHALALANRLHLLGIMPLRESEHHLQELQWARARCLFAGLGHAYHAPIFAQLHALSPWCPVDPMENREEWEQRYRAAHHSCGWPIGLLLVPWSELRKASSETKTPVVLDWHTLLAEAHILKHLRLDRRADGDYLVALYRGEANEIEAVTGSSQLVPTMQLPWLAQKLGASGKTNPLSVALTTKLRQIPPGALLERESLLELPPQVFRSPGAYLVPDVAELGGYFQHGLTLAGVKIADAGRIVDYQAYAGAADDVLRYAWPIRLPPVKPEKLAQWELALPATYDAEDWPTDVLVRYFPNFAFLSDAHRAMLDALLCAQVMRADSPRLSQEFPAFCLLPAEATPGGSTNQGKSTCAEAILHALAPNATYIQSSAGDAIGMRALNWQIAEEGTAGFDEFQLSEHPLSPMNRNRIQTLTTGRAVDVPKVRENRGGTYTLRAPLVYAPKFVDLPDDLKNRFYIYWMDRMPAEGWDNQERAFQAVNGGLSALMRLAALTKAGAHAFVGWLANQDVHGSEHGSRFVCHRLLASRILSLRSELSADQALAAVDGCVAAMAMRHAEHMIQAEDSHLVAIMREGTAASRLQLECIVDALDDSGMMKFAGQLRAIARTEIGWVRATSLLNARATIINPTATGEPLRVRLAGLLSPAFAKHTDRSLASALVHGLAARFTCPAPDGSIPLPGLHGLTGWRMAQKSDETGSNSRWYRLYNDNPGHPFNSIGRLGSPVA